jgi:hypothetical protein
MKTELERDVVLRGLRSIITEVNQRIEPPLSKSTIQRLIRAGDLRVSKVGSLIMATRGQIRDSIAGWVK